MNRRKFLGAIMAATLAGLSRELGRLRAEVARHFAAENPLLRDLRADPARIFTRAGMTPDPWQAGLLRCPSRRLMMLCTRQGGKSLTAAALALRDALLRPRALVLLLSPTQRQSGELFKDKVKRLYNALGRPVATVQESALTMELANGSRVVSLPGDEETVRGYSGVTTLVVDEAARVLDALYLSVRPMLAVSRGRLVCLSTPFGRRGWFWETWHSEERWERVKITADQCPRITAEFLAEERKALGPRWFSQEYHCTFEDMVGAVFSGEDIDALLCPQVKAEEFPA
jgi:hypothetical protein